MIPMIPALIYFMRVRNDAPQQATQRLIFGLKAFNVVVGLMAAGIGILWLATPSTVSAAVLGATTTTSDPYTALGAAISTGLAAIGAGVAVSGTGSAAVGAIAEKPESFGRALIFVGLAEGIAIYGLIISFMILNR
jgi:V/A-type H+-transporting ATPase subunit K